VIRNNGRQQTDNCILTGLHAVKIAEAGDIIACVLDVLEMLMNTQATFADNREVKDIIS